MTSNLPSGIVTFLFTDIEGSTKIARQFPEKWDTLCDLHHSILKSTIEAHNGYVFQIIGDAFCATFHTIQEGVSAAVEVQRRLAGEDWGQAPIKIYRGYLTLVKVQRVMSVAYGGQILLSNDSVELLQNELPKTITLRDMKEHRLKGLPDLERLWQIVTPDLQQDFPPLSSLNTIPNNLPASTNCFIGRDKEINDFQRRLVGENASIERLHTITGIGGAGKTRFALQIASKVLNAFKDGAWFVELAPLREISHVAKTIAKALGLSESPGKSIEETLTDCCSCSIILNRLLKLPRL